MNRAHDRRLQELERGTAPPVRITQQDILEAARAIRAGEAMPATVALFWKAWEVLKVAEVIEARRT